MKPTRPRTVLIIEPHLTDRAGHPMLYARAFVERFASLGWRSVILAHRHYSGPSMIAGARVIPTFRRSYFETRDRQRPAIQRVLDSRRKIGRMAHALGGAADRLARLMEPPPFKPQIK